MIACDILYHPAGFGHGHRWLAMHCPFPRPTPLKTSRTARRPWVINRATSRGPR